MSAQTSMLLRDPSQFRELSNWDVELKQIEPGHLKTQVSVWAGKDLTVIDLSFDRAVHQVGTARHGFLSFGLPDPGSLKTWLGRDVVDTSVMMFGSDEPFEGLSTHSFSGLTFSISKDRAANIAMDCGMDIGATLDGATKSKTSDVGNAQSRLRLASRRFISDGAGSKSPDDEEDLILFLLEMLASPRIWTGDKATRQRERAVRNAVEFMHANLDGDLSITEICARTGVSAPTLRRGFLDSYGVSPKQFHIRTRLNAVRAELVANPDARRVAHVANAYGFWHMGQFANCYRSFFGELPSQTGKRTKAAI